METFLSRQLPIFGLTKVFVNGHAIRLNERMKLRIKSLECLVVVGRYCFRAQGLLDFREVREERKIRLGNSCRFEFDLSQPVLYV